MGMGLQIELRKILHGFIEEYINVNDLPADVESSYFPEETVEALVTRTKIKLVIIGFNAIRERILRDKSIEVVVPLEVSLQRAINPKDVEGIDALVALHEALLNICEDDFESNIPKKNFSWMRTEPRLDENGLPYSYQQLSRDGIFHAIFIPSYTYLKEPGLPSS